MFLLIFSLLYFSSIVFPLGYGLARWMGIRVRGFVIPLLLGLIFTMIAAGIYAIWLPLDAWFSILMMLLALLFWIKNYQNIFQHFTVFAHNFSHSKRDKKIFWWLAFISGLVWASTTNFIYDHETYFIQTQQWLETYGLVPGLANLQLLLGQHSLWHIAQTALKIPAFDAYGFYLNSWLWLLCLADINFSKYQVLSNEKLRLILNLSLVPLLMFIGTASTDFPVYVFSTLVFLQWIQVFIFNKQNTCPQLILLFAAAAVLIKPTAVGILLPALHLNLKSLFKPTKAILFVGLLSIVFLIKNYIITGYLLFPLNINFGLQPDWQLPIEVLQYFNRSRPLWNDFVQDYSSAFETNNAFGSARWMLKASAYILALTGAVFFMAWLWFQRSIKARKVLLIFFSFTLLLAVFTVFNFRFVAHWWLFMAMIFWATYKKSIKSSFIRLNLIFFITAAAPFLFTKNIYQNLYNKNTSVFSADCKSVNTHGFFHNSLDGQAYFWETSDCDLPTVSTAQLEYFRRYFKIQPRPRGEGLNDGFISEPID